jgi:serine/threonine protein kinase
MAEPKYHPHTTAEEGGGGMKETQEEKDQFASARGVYRMLATQSESASASRDSYSSVGSNNDQSSEGAADRGEPIQPPPLRVVTGLGMGGYSVVVVVEHLQLPVRYAMKVISKESANRRKDKHRISNELQFLRDLPPCPFVCRCQMAFESKLAIFFVVDLCSGGDLFFHLERRTRQGLLGLGEDLSRLVLAEIAAGLIHLHSNNVVHRDIKVENIMFDAQGHVKIIDLGLSKRLHNETGRCSPTGSLIYMAPELLHARMGGRFTDWWAYGIVAHELLTGRSPWSSLTDKPLIREEIRSKELVFPTTIAPSSRTFLRELLDRDPMHRLGSGAIEEILSSPFFSEVDFNALWRGELPGYPINGELCVLPEESARAYACYQSIPHLTNPTLEWSLGIDFVSEHPV